MSLTSSSNPGAGADFNVGTQDLIDALDQVINQTLDAATEAAGVDDMTGMLAATADVMADEAELVSLLGNADDGALIGADEWLVIAGHL